MAEYQFVNSDGTIVTEDYDGTTVFTPDLVLQSLQQAFSRFPYSAELEQVEGMEDVFHVKHPGQIDFGDIYICAKGTTPGGRSALKNEQRIQPKAKFLNYVFNKHEQGKCGVFLGVYQRDGETIFCTWKVAKSNAATPDTPISKQIKIDSIAKAMKEGFVQHDKGRGEYACAFKPEFLYFYLRNCDWLHTGQVKELAEHTEPEVDDTERLEGGRNVLLYGVPGSGKSWTIEHEYCPKGSIVERLVFHPDYTNADFIGQILPVVDEDKQVTYEFTAGPFTTILREAYKDPLRQYILIIEEINRGNAPAIFGEVFQLLDRKIAMQDGDDGYPVGTSEYGVTHKYMAEYIYDDPKHKIRIPSNLSIIGTMNTSDQNVFTLDTAFQRRWKMRLIENNFTHVRDSLKKAEILDTKVTWQRFCETVNEIIVGNRSKMASAEDKRLGVYFVHESEIEFDDRAKPSEGFPTILTEQDKLMKDELIGELTDEGKIRLAAIREATMNNRAFPEKVIKYLWDDAFKFNPEALFDTENMGSLEQVIRTFVYSKGEDRLRIFKETVRTALKSSSEQPQ